MRSVERAREYRNQARECLREAEFADCESRAILLNKANYLMRLAENCEHAPEEGSPGIEAIEWPPKLTLH